MRTLPLLISLTLAAQAQTTWDVAKTFEADAGGAGTKTGIFSDLDAMVKTISEMAKPRDHILIMSNGGFGGVHGKILHALAMRSMRAAD